jgi:geranylgeranylglycerol-phosphate geranylgeranyltransferase
MTLNDYYDRSIDLINNPKRPIPSGAVSPRLALVTTFICAMVGTMISAFLNTLALLITLVSLVLMVYYNTVGKRTGFFGNIIVSVCVSLPFIFGGYVVENMKLLLWLFAVMAFLSNLGREVTKGITDITGDSVHGVKTLAVVFGPRTASLIAVLLFVGAIGLSFFPPILRLVSAYYLPAVAVSDVGFITSILSLLRDQSVENAKTVKSRVLIWMALGLVAFLLGAYNPSHLFF